MKFKTDRWSLALFSIIACGILGALAFDKPAAGVATATLFMCGVPAPKRKENDDDDAGGGGTLTQEKFQEKVLNTMKTVKTSQEKMLENYDNLDASTKKTFEELTSVKNKFTGLDSEMEGMKQLIAKLRVQMVLEGRMANGGTAMSLGQRTIQNKDLATELFNEICRHVKKDGNIIKAMGEDSSPGSTLINDEMAKDVYDSLLRFGAWSTLGVRPVGTKNLKVPIKTVRPNANFILTEGGAISDDTAKAGTSVTLEMEIIAVLLNVSLQLIEDGEIDIVADVLDDFIEATNYRIDFAAFQGTGTADATHGGVTGLFNFGTAAVAAATRTTIAATKYDDWLKCLTAVDAGVLSRPARWWMHPTLMAAAVGVQDTNGRPIFQTALESPTGGILNLFGFPVTMVGAAPSTNTINSKVAAFGDPRAMGVGARKAFTFEQSDHATWTTLQRSFRGYMRADAIGVKASALSVMTLPGA